MTKALISLKIDGKMVSKMLQNLLKKHRDAEVRNSKLEDGRQKLKDGRERLENGCRNQENGRRKLENGRRKPLSGEVPGSIRRNVLHFAGYPQPPLAPIY